MAKSEHEGGRGRVVIVVGAAAMLVVGGAVSTSCVLTLTTVQEIQGGYAFETKQAETLYVSDAKNQREYSTDRDAAIATQGVLDRLESQIDSASWVSDQTWRDLNSAYSELNGAIAQYDSGAAVPDPHVKSSGWMWITDQASEVRRLRTFVQMNQAKHDRTASEVHDMHTAMDDTSAAVKEVLQDALQAGQSAPALGS